MKPIFVAIFALMFLAVSVNSFLCQYRIKSTACRSRFSLTMAFDEFLSAKLDSIKRTFDALTERLADPDLANDRKQMLTISRERSSMEPTILAYNEWKELEKERKDLVEMEQASDSDQDIKEMSRDEQKIITARQQGIEESITLMLLPKDPNDDRNVMLEIRAGTGGDEASIWAGDLVGLYRKYAENSGWRVTPVRTFLLLLTQY